MLTIIVVSHQTVILPYGSTILNQSLKRDIGSEQVNKMDSSIITVSQDQLHSTPSLISIQTILFMPGKRPSMHSDIYIEPEQEIMKI